MKNKNFTTTLPENVLLELANVAEILKVGRNDIIVEAFVQWNKVRKQELVRQSYGVARTDKEWQTLAEMGIGEL